MILRRHGCPAAFARRLPQSNGSPAPFTALHAASPAQRKKKMRCAQEAHVSTRAQRSGDAQGGTADDGPGVVSQVVSQVVKNAPAREAVAAGPAARAAAEAMESSWSVARGKSRRRKWINGKGHRSKLGSGWRGRDGFSGSSRPAQPHASTLHDGVRVRLGCFTNQHRLSARYPVPKVMLKLELQRWPRTSDACGPAP